MQVQVFPKVTLVGAGPGDPELISLKAIKALEAANVVLYDALVNEDLLKYVPEDAIKIYAGKRAGNHHLNQEQINNLLVDMALSYGHVVRLKGGDPFVFGRGHEEIDFARHYEIETSVIPGISSAVSVPELQSIPLTKRGVSESFWVLTGTTRAGTISPDLSLAAQSNATVVILMGLNKLREITGIFKAFGKSKLPVAVIQNGSLPNERFVLGEIDTIYEIVSKEKIGAPSIIIVGEVVKEHPEYVYETLQEREFYKDLQIA